jgi:hypothetical protein
VRLITLLRRNFPSRYSLPKVLIFRILDAILADFDFWLGLSRGW